MKTTPTKHEYVYANSHEQHHHAYITDPLLELLQQDSPTQNNKPRILDLGCGNGSLSHVLAQTGYEVTGIEASTSGIRFAQIQYPQCQFIEASIYELPYEMLEGQFDAVVSAEVIEHLLYPRELIRSAKRCLKPGGQLIVTTPYHGYWKNLALALTGKMDQHFTALWDGGHIKFFSQKTLKQLMEQEGFSQLQFTFTGRYPYLWKSMICQGIVKKEEDLSAS